MFSRNLVLSTFFILFAALLLDSQVESRYLPTRSNGDKVDKIEELVKELLESEREKLEMQDVPRWRPENKLFYKREAKAPQPSAPH